MSHFTQMYSSVWKEIICTVVGFISIIIITEDFQEGN